MKATAITLLALLLPLDAQAQAVKLTLNCQSETASDRLHGGGESSSSNSFSASVYMRTDGSAVIVTTSSCPSFLGSFDELQVQGECEITITTVTIHSWLEIDRISGAFELGVLMSTDPHKPPSSFVAYDGHCKLGNKLF